MLEEFVDHHTLWPRVLGADWTSELVWITWLARDSARARLEESVPVEALVVVAIDPSHRDLENASGEGISEVKHLLRLKDLDIWI